MGDAPQEPETVVLASTRRYVFAEEGDRYLIFDLEAGTDPVATYPGDEGGYAAAEAHYDGLRRSSRTILADPVRLLGWIFAIATPLWVVNRAIVAIIVSSDRFGGNETLYRVTSAIDEALFALVLGTLGGLLAIYIVRRLTERDRRAEP